jgi:hypothetical protein
VVCVIKLLLLIIIIVVVVTEVRGFVKISFETHEIIIPDDGHVRPKHVILNNCKS